MRIDAGVIEGDTVTIFYDPMIAKLIVWDRTRADALQRMREALAECDIVGLKSNIEFLERLVRHPSVVEGRIDTGYLDRHLDEFLPASPQTSPALLFAAATAALLHDEQTITANPADPHSPWASSDAWRMGHPGKRIVGFENGDQRADVVAKGSGGNYELAIGDSHCHVFNARLSNGVLSAAFDGAARRCRARVGSDRVFLHDDSQRTVLRRVDAFAFVKSTQRADDRVAAPMPGRIVVVKTKPGDTVEAGQELLVMEAMKMEIALKAPHAGKIEAVSAAVGDFVEADAILVRFAKP